MKKNSGKEETSEKGERKKISGKEVTKKASSGSGMFKQVKYNKTKFMNSIAKLKIRCT